MKKREAFQVRKKRTRSRIQDDTDRVRLFVHRSNKHIYAQLIDNKKGNTLLTVSDVKKGKEKNKQTKTETALHIGEDIAKRAIKKGIKDVVFDRSGYKYHGRVKALSEGARKGGLNF